MSLKNFMSYEDAATVLGEYADKVNELKSGLTNYENQNNLNLEVPNRKNLINSNAYSNGYFTSEGVLTENQYYYATDYIKVEPNTDYVVSGFTGGGAYFVYYNASKTVLSTVGDTTTTFKTPANTAFVRLSIKRDGMTNPQMELGTTATAYTPFIPSVESRLETVESGYLSKQFVVINGTSIYDFVRNTKTPTGYIVADVQLATDNPVPNSTSFAIIYKPIANGNYSIVKIEKGGQLFISGVLLPNDTAFTFTEFAKKSELTTFTGYVTSGKWYKIGEFRLNSFVWFLRYVIIACNGANIKCFKLRSTPTDGFNNSDNAVNQLIGTDQIGGLKYSADYKSISILLKGTATGNIQYSLLSQSGENQNVVLTEPVETDYVDSDIDIIN